MLDLSIYLTEVSEEFSSLSEEGTIGARIIKNDSGGFPDLKESGVAVVYVPEYRRSVDGYTGNNDEFRCALYNLFPGDSWSGVLYDLGTVVPGNKIEDTYYAVSQIVSELVKHKIVPLVVGGSQDLTLALYKGFETLEQTVNICTVDAKLDIGEPTDEPTSNGFISHLLMQRPCYLFNYANIGLQRPKVQKKEMDLFNKLYFDYCRLGEFNDDFKTAEPHLRNADILSVDIASMKGADIDPANYSAPNGFRAEQLCQIAKYAGMSDKMSAMGVFNVNPDQVVYASNLIAEVIWYFTDGMFSRVGDFPIGGKQDYKKFYVHLEEFSDDLVFYKSNKSDRWWLEVSYPAREGSKYERHHLVPCNEKDYAAAMDNVVPDLWWKTLQKLS